MTYSIRSRTRCILGTRPPVMRTEYCDYVLAALRVFGIRYVRCCVLCIVYQVAIMSVVYWVLRLSYIGY